MKIQILGYSGSGKSTLARTLSGHLSLPVLYLDTVYWLPGWKERPLDSEAAGPEQDSGSIHESRHSCQDPDISSGAPLEGQRQILKRFLDENFETGWVIDGNYSKNQLDRRAEEADLIIFLDFGRLRCMHRILKRNIMFRGKSRFSVTEGCDEKIDWEFLRWAMWDSRKETSVRRKTAICRAYPDKFVEFKNPRRLKAFLAERFGM